MQELTTEVLVVGGGAGGTAAALQAARRGVDTILVSEFSWLGGMLTAAGVSAPDGNELAAFQTGIWGAFLRELQQRQPQGLDHAWVSFFTYEPRIGAAIFADWVQALPNLRWIAGQVPLEVLRDGDRITGVRFAEVTIRAQVIVDGTELGDVLALGAVPHRWGWEWQSQWGEPSAPIAPNPLTERYTVQSPTWVVMLQDFGEGAIAPEIPAPPDYREESFVAAWEGYGWQKFLDYGRLPGDRFMLNWPQAGNDYGERVERLIASPQARQDFHQAAYWHSLGFAHFIQTKLGRRYGLAADGFPPGEGLGGGAFALHPYYRESRRLQGWVTVREQDILPLEGGGVAALPVNAAGKVTAIAVGNYVNDHHYPDAALTKEWLPLKSKALRWGGRWTGTPFALPYGCLVPVDTDGLLVCEKNISVSHMANGATRLQPLVLGIGQAAGMAAALCVEQHCQPRELAVRPLQNALLTDRHAPAAIVPLLNLAWNNGEWLQWQQYYLEHPAAYPSDGNCPITQKTGSERKTSALPGTCLLQDFSGEFCRNGEQAYSCELATPAALKGQRVSLVTLWPKVNEQLQQWSDQAAIAVRGRWNRAGNWVLVEEIVETHKPIA